MRVSSDTYKGNGQDIWYDWIPFDRVTRINEIFGNQTIIAPPEGFLDVHGGNVAVQIHGFFHGPLKLMWKSLLEGMRAEQAGMAHVPGKFSGIPIIGPILKKIFGDTGFGQLSLWFRSISLVFISEFSFHRNMVIKAMEFEHSAEFKDEYAYTITFEKLSLGQIQYIIDGVTSFTKGIFARRRRRNSNIPTNHPRYGDGHDYTIAAPFAGFENRRVNIESEVDLDFIRDIVDSINPIEEIGQLVEVITKSDDGVKNLSSSYTVTPRFNNELEWYRIPFQDGFPQSFTFTFSGNDYKMEWKILSSINDDNLPDNYLHLTLYKNDSLIYTGKIVDSLQFTFDAGINIFIKNFNLYTDDDGTPIFSVGGLISGA